MENPDTEWPWTPQCCACSCGICNTNVSDCLGACCTKTTQGYANCSLLNSDECNRLKSDAQYESVCRGGCQSACELPDGTQRCETSIGCCKARADLMFLIDISLSMIAVLPNENITKKDAALAAIRNSVQQTNPIRDKLGLASFNEDGYLNQQLTFNRDQFETSLQNLVFSGLTCSADGLVEVLGEFMSERHRSGSAQPALVVLGDGSNTNEICDEMSIEISNTMKEMGIIIYSIQFGDFDSQYLQEISSGPEYFYVANSSMDLQSVYLQIYSDICENSEYQEEETLQSCGSIRLADGTCWECCCHSDFDDEWGGD